MKLRNVVCAALCAALLAGCGSSAASSAASSEAESTAAASSEAESTETAEDVPEQVPVETPEGLFRLDGVDGTASMYLDGQGGFELYYASGATEAVGWIAAEEEMEGLIRYDLYGEDNTYISGFYADSDTTLHFGNDSMYIYVKTDEYGSNPDADIPMLTESEPLMTVNARWLPEYFDGYLFEYMTEDGALTIVNRGKASAADDPEAYVQEVLTCDALLEIDGFTWDENGFGYSTLDHPCMGATFTTGSNEDLRSWVVLYIETDSEGEQGYCYVYAMGVSADWYDAIAPTMEDTMDGGLYVRQPGEAVG